MRLTDCLPNQNKITIAISGLNKNAGKTVVLNRLLHDAVAINKIVAITSIGYDGEKTDKLDGHQKPQIYVPSGTIVATASAIIEKAGQDIEILVATGQHTPLGQVYIVRYHQSGFTEIVGPSSLTGLIKLKQMMIDFADLIIVDGALNRLSQISPRLCDAAFMAVGGRGSIAEIVEKTRQQLSLIKLPLAPVSIREKVRQILSGQDCAVITDSQVSSVPCPQAPLIKTADQTGCLIYRGALTFSLVQKLQTRYWGVVVADTGSVFITAQQVQALAKKGFQIFVGWSLPLAGITLNPNIRMGNTLDIVELGVKISTLCPDLPVVDVVSRLWFKGGEPAGRLE